MPRFPSLLLLLPIISYRAFPTFPTIKPENNITFEVNDCSALTASNLLVNSYSGTATPTCDKAKIFKKPEKKPI